MQELELSFTAVGQIEKLQSLKQDKEGLEFDRERLVKEYDYAYHYYLFILAKALMESDTGILNVNKFFSDPVQYPITLLDNSGEPYRVDALFHALRFLQNLALTL